jgi:pilus assembly protein CpaC
MLTLIAMLLIASPEPLRLAPGGQEVLKVPGLTRMAIGDDSIADVRVVGAGEVLVLGRQRGRTTLSLWANGRLSTRSVLVEDGKTSDLGRLVHELVSPTLKVERFGEVSVVQGTLDGVDELERLNALVGDDPSVKVLVRMNPRALPVVAQRISEAFAKHGLAQAKATNVGDRILLEGNVGDEKELARALTIARAIYAQTALP